jgi:hypothetical protein
MGRVFVGPFASGPSTRSGPPAVGALVAPVVFTGGPSAACVGCWKAEGVRPSRGLMTVEVEYRSAPGLCPRGRSVPPGGLRSHAARPILPWALVLSQVLGRRVPPRRSLPNDRGIRRRARTGCESVPATSPRDRSRPRSARGLHDGWQYMTRGKAIARGVAAGRESRAIGAGPSIPPALRRLQNWCLADPASDQNPAPGRLPV